MDYQKHYNLLTERAKTRVLEGYTERHHIVPRCMGGRDGKDNIVRLTAREHFVAHLLLVKIHSGNHKLVYAVYAMCRKSKNQVRNNRMYGWIREEYSKLNSRSLVEKHGEEKAKEIIEKMTKASTGRVHSEETREKQSVARKGKPSVLKGRKLGKYSKERGDAISKAKKEKGRPAWNKGVTGYKTQPASEERKEKTRKSNTGKVRSEESKKKNSDAHKGKACPHKGRKLAEIVGKKKAKELNAANSARQLGRTYNGMHGLEKAKEITDRANATRRATLERKRAEKLAENNNQ